jgi:hypothetical protein
VSAATRHARRSEAATRAAGGPPPKAVDADECPTPGRCRCKPKCRWCDARKHTTVHGCFYGQPLESGPYGHEFDTGRKLSDEAKQAVARRSWEYARQEAALRE